METQFFNIEEHILEASYIREYPRALANGQDEDLQLQIKHYVPKQAKKPGSKSITIIGAHANAFPKELYEPFWDDLWTRCSEVANLHIAGIWIADVAWQGLSFVLNEQSLGNDPCWYDHSRDLLHMVNTFRKQMPLPIVGIGHSMGGNQLTNLACIHPRLFASLVLIDPVINDGQSFTNSKEFGGARFGPASASTHRKDRWESREIAATSFRKSPFYRAWDPRVLELFIKFGLRDLPTTLYPDESKKNGTPGVTLTTPKTQEVWSFLRPNYDAQGSDGNPIDRTTHADIDTDSKSNAPFYRPEMNATYRKLPNLRPPTYYIMGGVSNLGPQETQYKKVPITGTGIGGSGGVKEGQVDYTFVKGIGHLIPMDVPTQTAELTTAWLERSLTSWFTQEEQYQRSWVSLPQKDKITIDKAWMDQVGPPPSRPQKPKGKL